jgi:hypothetical protein
MAGEKEVMIRRMIHVISPAMTTILTVRKSIFASLGINAILLEFQLQRAATDSQNSGSMGTIAAGLLQGSKDHRFFDFLERSARR